MSSSAFALFLAIVIGQTFAQSAATYLSEFPLCAQQALVQGVANSGCVITDTTCICENNHLVQTLATAIQADCDAADQATSLNLTSRVCPDSPILSSLTRAASLNSTVTSTASQSDTAALVLVSSLTTTTFISLPQPTSVPVTIAVTYSDPNASSTWVGNSSSDVLITDTSSLADATTTSSSEWANNTWSSTQSASGTTSSTGGSPSAMKRIGWVALGMGVMGAIFAEL